TVSTSYLRCFSTLEECFSESFDRDLSITGSSIFQKGRLSMSKDNRKENGKGESRSRPVHECKLGRISAAVWPQETQNGLRHNVSITRSYKDGDTWKRSTSFGLGELPLVARVADMALAWIYSQRQEKNGQERNGDTYKVKDNENIPF